MNEETILVTRRSVFGGTDLDQCLWLISVSGQQDEISLNLAIHLDEVFVKLIGEAHYLWQAVEHEGEILESDVT